MRKPIQPLNEVMKSDPTPAIPDQETIKNLAYELWFARGCPIGSPEVDWYPAEEQLKRSAALAQAAAA
jgi:hypothetical protein